MSKRWPNTLHWQRVVKTFRMTNGAGWRTAAAIVLGCERSALRGTIDRDRTNSEIIEINSKLIFHIRRYHAHLDRVADRIGVHMRSIEWSTQEQEFSRSNFDIENSFFPQSATTNIVVDGSAPPTPIQIFLREMMDAA